MAYRAGTVTIFAWQAFIFIDKCDHVRSCTPVEVHLCIFSGIVTPKVIYEEATDLDRFITNTGILMLHFYIISMGIYVISCR